jgi:hypothetical protein
MPVLICLFVSLFFSTQLNAQLFVADTAIHDQALQQAFLTQVKTLQNSLLLYKGPVYKRKALFAKGHPFLIADSFVVGSIVFGNHRYSKVNMEYDIESGEVIVKNNEDGNPIVLPLNKLNSFNIWNRQFERFPSTINYSFINESKFYEVLYRHSAIEVYILKEKKLNNPKEQNETIPFYDEIVTIFFVVNNVLFRIESHKDMLHAFGEGKLRMKKMMKENGIRFSNITEQKLINIATYYAQSK